MNTALVLCLLGTLLSCCAFAQDTKSNAQEIAELKAQMQEMRKLYDARIAQMQAASSAVPLLGAMGFDLKEFGPSSFAVSAIPSCMQLSEAEDFLAES